jgi:nitrate/nitrite transporter NarK
MSFTHGAAGWPGWKWLFLLEAIPALIVGVACMFYLDSRIRDAKWLTEEQKQLIEQDIATETRQKQQHASLRAVFADGRLWRMCWIYFTGTLGQYALTFWMPTLIKATGITSLLNIGLVTAIPYICVVIAMIALGASSDRRRERRWHEAGPLLVGGIALVLSMLVGGTNTILAILLLSIAAAGIISSAPLFWALPTSFLTGTAAAAGIATITVSGNLAGFFGPPVIGWLKDVTHTNLIPMTVVAAIVVAGALTVIALPKHLFNK